MPTTRSNPNAIKLPTDASMPHPDLQENESKPPRNFDENSSDTDTENYTMSMADATGLSIFSDFLHGRLGGKERDWGSSNLDTTLSGDSSFAFSWGGAASEFEQNATRKVIQLYKNVQCVLYQDSEIPNLLKENPTIECQIWREYFPHLRVVGRQFLQSSDDFIQVFEREGDTPINLENPLDLNKNELQLIGTSVCCHGTQVNEEIYCEVGVYEEFFAFDSSPSSSGNEKNIKACRKRSKLPPVSPSSCIKEAILETVFEQLWEELAPLMEPLVEFCKSNKDSQIIASIQSSRTSSGIRPQLPALHNAFPSLPPVFSEHAKFYNDSILPPPINFQRPNPLQTTQVVPQQADYTALRNAIQIRPFPLQSRGSVTTSQPPDLPPDPRNDIQYILSPPTTAGTGYNSVKPFQYQQAKPFQRSSDSSTGVLSQHRPKTQGRKGQLRPLGADNSKTSGNAGGILGSEVGSYSNTQPGQLETVLFGHKMTLDRLATPGSQTRSPIPWSKPYRQLPPIEVGEYRFSPSPIRQQRAAKVCFSSRVSSAGLDSAKERKLNQTSKIGDDTRPQTIHTLRSDVTQQQEISVPLKEIYQKISTPLSPISLRGASIRSTNAKLSNHTKFVTNKPFNSSNLENNGILNSISGVFPEETVGRTNIGFGKLGSDRNKLKTVAAIRGISY